MPDIPLLGWFLTKSIIGDWRAPGMVLAETTVTAPGFELSGNIEGSPPELRRFISGALRVAKHDTCYILLGAHHICCPQRWRFCLLGVAARSRALQTKA